MTADETDSDDRFKCEGCGEQAEDTEECPDCERRLCTNNCIAGKAVSCFQCEEAADGT